MEANPSDYQLNLPSLSSPLNTLFSDLEFFQQKSISITCKMVRTYEKGCELLEQFGDPNEIKPYHGFLHEIKTYSEYINYYLETVTKKAINHDSCNYNQLWMDYDNNQKWLESSALNLEELGRQTLPEDKRAFWDYELSIYKKMFAPALKLNSEITKLLIYFIVNEDKCSLNKIWKIISENLPNRYFVCEKDCEKLFLSLYQKFQKEFKQEKKIWQPIKEIISKNINPNYIDQLAI